MKLSPYKIQSEQAGEQRQGEQRQGEQRQGEQRQGEQMGKLHNVYHLFGAEPLIIEETLAALRKQCAALGYSERQKLHVETGFNWHRLSSANRSLSLFSTKKVIELRMPAGKPGDKGAKALSEFTAHCTLDTVLILISGAIERSAQNSKWFKALDKAGASVEAAKIQKQDLPRWIEQRLKQQQLNVEAGVADLIAHYVEGNLLAAAQEINFLHLHQHRKGVDSGAQNRPLTTADVEALISDQARFTAFAYIDACLAGEASRANRILSSLESEKLQPILLLGALARETRKLVILADAKAAGQKLAPLFQRLGIWSSRGQLTGQALNRVSAIGWKRIHSRMADLDQMIKGQRKLQNKNLWEELERVGLAMCGSASMLQ